MLLIVPLAPLTSYYQHFESPSTMVRRGERNRNGKPMKNEMFFDPYMERIRHGHEKQLVPRNNLHCQRQPSQVN